EAGHQLGVDGLDELVSRGVEGVDVSFGGRDGVVIRVVAAGIVFAAPLHNVVLVEREQQSEQSGGWRAGDLAVSPPELGDDGVDGRQVRQASHHIWPCRYRSTDRAASEP